MSNRLRGWIAGLKAPKRKAVCVDCIHHRYIAVNPGAPSAWYNHFCGASPLPEAIDPVTGKKGYGSFNDLCVWIITDEPYEYCRDINKDGHCPLFQEKEDNSE